MKERLKALGARLGPFVLTALVALGVGYWTGARGQPDRVTEASHVEAKTEVARTEEIKEAVKVAEKTDKKRTTKRTTFRPDGTVSSETTSTAETVKDRHEDHVATIDVSEKRVDFHTEYRYKEIEYKKNWRVSALIGAQLQNPIANGGNPFAPNLFLAGALQARLWVLWVGPFVAGTIPLDGGVRSKGSVYAGLALGVEF